MRALFIKDKNLRSILQRKELFARRLLFYKQFYRFLIPPREVRFVKDTNVKPLLKPTLYYFFSIFVCSKKKLHNFSFVRIRNRCVLSGRARGILVFFKVSRIVFRTMASKGLLPGVRKASL